MKSLVLREIGSLKLEDIPVPEPGPGQKLLRVTRCALCRTDAKMWAHGQRDLALPRVLGHEFCGTVGGTEERFVAWPGETCGKCSHCTGSAENLCKHMKILGFNRDGGLAEKVVVPDSALIPTPNTLGDDVACLAEPLACSLNALEQSGVASNHRVLIFGGGSVGLLMGLAVRARKALPFVVEPNETKLLKSEAFRSRLNIRASCTCDRDEFDVAINACPSTDTLFTGISHLKAGGCFCLFSGLKSESAIPAEALNEVHYRQLKLVGAYGCTRAQLTHSLLILEDYQSAVRLLIEEQVPLQEAASRFSKVLSGESLKIIVNMEG